MSIMRKGRLVSFDYFPEEFPMAAVVGIENKFKVTEVRKNPLLGDVVTAQHVDYPAIVATCNPKNFTFSNEKKPTSEELKKIYSDSYELV